MNEKIISFLSSIKRGTFGVTIVATTIPEMNKTNNPYYGRVVKCSYIPNIALGYSYGNMLNNKGNKVNNTTDSDYQVEKPKGKKWIKYPFYLESEKNGKLLLRVNYYKSNFPNIKSQYLLDGKLATSTELKEIKSFFRKKTTYSKKQADFGLVKEEDQVIATDYTFDGIMLLKQGEKLFTRTDASIEDIKKFFSLKVID